MGQTNLHDAFHELFLRVNRLERGRKLTLITANGLWRQAGQTFLKSYFDLASTQYRAEIATADFKSAPAEASGKINSWIAAHTRGRIQSACTPAQFDSSSSLVLCDVIYFKGTWHSQFKKSATQPAPFHLSTNETVTLPMMRQESEFRTVWLDEPAATLIALPYYGGDVEMVIVLPDAQDGLAELESALTLEALNSWLSRLDAGSSSKSWVLLPRFSTRQTVDLVPALKSLGMGTAFCDKSDFSGMDGTHLLYISHAVHEAFVEVNETGTQATAATMFQAKSRSMAGRFIADHPFLFLIRDKGSGLILFLGRLVDPTK